MPLVYDEELGVDVNVCIECGTGPVSEFTDRCEPCRERSSRGGAGRG